jgi:Uma2 family endonuclease
MVAPLAKRLVSVEEYYRMAEAGIFHADERLELIRGEIYEMSPIGNRHAGCVIWLVDCFAAVRDRALVNPQNPLCLPQEHSVPQPDVVLLRRRKGYYRDSPPEPEDVLLLVEVADSTLAYDRDVKVPLYSEGGVPEVWLVDLNGGSIGVYRHPGPRGYAEIRQYRRGETLTPLVFPELVLAVEEILG